MLVLEEVAMDLIQFLQVQQLLLQQVEVDQELIVVAHLQLLQGLLELMVDQVEVEVEVLQFLLYPVFHHLIKEPEILLQ